MLFGDDARMTVATYSERGEREKRMEACDAR